jgi:hypothetical protein
VAPAVVGVTPPTDGRYLAGQSLDFDVQFSEPVLADTTGGTPRLPIILDTGGTVFADYVSGSGSSTWRFTYVVSAGQSDNTGITLSGLIDANGGTMQDAAGNPALAALAGVPSTAAIFVGPPLATSVPTTSPATLAGLAVALATVAGQVLRRRRGSTNAQSRK